MENFEDLYAGASCLMMLTTLPVNSQGEMVWPTSWSMVAWQVWQRVRG